MFVLTLRRSFFVTGPHIFLTVFRSTILNAFLTSVLFVQAADPKVGIGRIRVL